MKIKGVEHIGIAITNLGECIATLKKTFGLKESHRERIEASNVEVVFFECGTTQIELVTPTSDASPISVFLSKRGNGIHHICLDVEDIEGWLAALKAKGIELIDSEPRRGAHGKKVAFLSPKSTCGFLIELSEQVE